ncbi:MAG: EAL domain-containing protein [Eubacteriales bacterium]|nr:EAL domain-containing protein [Eubacteriales bacterium]
MSDQRTVLIVDDENRFDEPTLFEPEYLVHRVASRAAAMAFLHKHQGVTITLINLQNTSKEALPLLCAVRGQSALDAMVVWICLDPGDSEGIRSSYEAGADELVYRLPDPAVLQYEIRRLKAFPIRYEKRDTPVFLAGISDVPSRYRTEELLRESKRKFASIMNVVPGGFALYDITGKPRLLYSNDVFFTFFEYTAEEFQQIIEEDYRVLIDPRDLPMVDKLLTSFSQRPQQIKNTFRILTKNHFVRWINASFNPMDGGTQLSAVIIDVTQDKENEIKNERMRVELSYRAEHDPLTGIYNREAFYRRTAEMLHAHPDTPYVILIMDIDRFRVLNDIFGKEVGDRVLINIGMGLKRILDDVGTYARMESDHFAACFPQSLLDMDRVLTLLDSDLKHEDIDFHVQLSYGIYKIHNINIPINHMCDRAAMAMKTIKGNVVKRFAFYDDTLRQAMLEENAILDEMNGALEQGEFKTYLQPIFSVDTQRPVSVEMLVRWEHPVKGLIPPAQFVPLFERNGFITRMDFYIWEKACQLLHQWKTEGYLLPISVNISRIDLYYSRLCEHLQSLVRRYDIDPSMLRLEITESAYSKDPDELVEIISRLRSLGFIVLMDDFGSGYSSLNVLMDMPVDILKLDMRFLAKLNTNPRASSILTSVIRMAKWLNMPVVAEGVETMEQLAFLRSVGCDQMQGYLLSKPISVEDYTRQFIDNQTAQIVFAPALQRDPIDLSRLWDMSAQAEALFGGMIGGMGIYELSGDMLEIRRVNDGYYELFGHTPKQVFDSAREALAAVHPDEREGLLRTCRQAIRSGRVERYVFRHIQYRSDHEIWLETRLRFLGKTGNNDVFCFIFNDITEQKEFEQARVLRNYAMVLRSVYANVFELNLTARRVRTIHSIGPQEPALPDEQPWRQLKTFLHGTLLNSDEELEQKIFTKGYLRKILKESPSDYYLLERKIHGENGEPSWASFTFIPVPSDAAEEIYLLCIADVDNRKRADELRLENQWLQLKQQEQMRYQALLDHLGTSLFEWDVKTGQTIVSSSFAQYALSSFDFTCLKSYKELEPFIFARDLNLCGLLVNDILAHGSGTVTLRLLEKNGNPVWCRVLCSRICEEHTGTVRYIAAISQIDEQIKNREGFLDEQRRFQAFADNFLVGLGIFEMRGKEQRILYLSDGYRQMVGYDENEHYYDETHSYSTIYPEDTPRFMEAVRNLQRTGKPFLIDYRVYHKDGRLIWMRTHNSIYHTPEPGVDHVFAVIEDITEMKTLRSQLSTLLGRLPMAIGVYDLTDTPAILYENQHMAAFFAALQAHTAEGGSSSEPYTAVLHTREELFSHLVQQSRKGQTEFNEMLTLGADGGSTVNVRFLAATEKRDERTDCYCALIDTAPAP